MQIASPLLVGFTRLENYRGWVRGGAFGISVALLLLSFRTQTTTPRFARPAWIVFGIISLSLLNPTTQTWLAGVAQVGLYFAILGPLFWVARLSINIVTLRRALT